MTEDETTTVSPTWNSDVDNNNNDTDSLVTTTISSLLDTMKLIDANSSHEEPTIMSVDDRLEVLSINADAFFLIIMGIIVFLMQCGFAFLEAGAVRSKNTVNILIKNMLDSLIGALSYWAIGWALAYGPGNSPFIGQSNFFSYNTNHSKYPSWFFQYVFAATAATIVSGSVAERCQFVAYIFYSTIITGWVYPPVSHWAWDSNAPGWLNELGFHDFAGSGVVHLTGGICALVSCIIIGPRKGKFDPDGKPNDMPGHSVPLAALGGGILLVCFLAFNGGSQTSISKLGDNEAIGLAVINTIIGGSAGGITVLFFNKYVLGQKWSYLMTLNGALTGMVSMCAGCNVYPIWACLIVAGIGGLVFISVHFIMLRFKLDDPLDAVGVHAGGGTVGIICVHFFSYGEGIFWKGNTIEPWHLLGINIAGAVCIATWAATWSFLIFYPLNYLNLLRIKPQAEFRGVDITEHGEAAYPVDAWVEIQYNRNQEEVGRRIPDVMQGVPSEDCRKKSQSYNMPGHMMPTAAIMMKNSKSTFGALPRSSSGENSGQNNRAYEDSEL